MPPAGQRHQHHSGNQRPGGAAFHVELGPHAILLAVTRRPRAFWNRQPRLVHRCRHGGVAAPDANGPGPATGSSPWSRPTTPRWSRLAPPGGPRRGVRPGCGARRYRGSGEIGRSDLRILAGGRTIRPVSIDGLCAHFILPGDCGSVVLPSGAATPKDFRGPGRADRASQAVDGAHPVSIAANCAISRSTTRRSGAVGGMSSIPLSTALLRRAARLDTGRPADPPTSDHLLRGFPCLRPKIAETMRCPTRNVGRTTPARAGPGN